MKETQMTLFDTSDDWTVGRRKGKTARDFYSYEAFTDKFKDRHTTDDCFTPPEVYRAVLDFVGTLTELTGREVVRPFCPGGDYENYDYPPGCIVVDNPPFSIYTKIVRFYLALGIDFFLFGPHLTQFVKDADCTYVITAADITYDNGAVVKTSFTTNLCPDLRIWLCPELKKSIENTQKTGKTVIAKNTYPDNVVTAAILGKIIHRGIELKIRKADTVQVQNLDALKQAGKGLFGSGFLLTKRAAAERAAAERAAAERAAGTCVQLSPREWAMIRKKEETGTP